MPNLRYKRTMPRTIRRRIDGLHWKLLSALMHTPSIAVPIPMATAERIRLAHYNALADMAEMYGFDRDRVGVSMSPMQPLEPGRMSLDMQMPPELATILHEKGFFNA